MDPDSTKRSGGPTAQQIDRIAGLLRAANYRHTAASAAGVEPVQLESWLAQGAAQEEGELHDLYVAVMAAEHEGEARHVTLIAKEAQSNWQAAAWILERRYPGRWARMSQRDKDKAIAEVTTPADAFAQLDQLAARRGQRA